MQEKNRETLRRALERLRSYAPGEELWSGVEAQLDRSPPVPGLDKLPTYAPPPQVWNTLNHDLDRDRVRQLGRRRIFRVAAVAASLLLLVGLLFPLTGSSPKVTVVVSEERAPSLPIDADWQEDDNRFEDLLRRLAADDEPAVNILKVELEELTGARRDVEEMLNRYGQDPQLIRQLGEIERERSDIYRQLIAHM